MSNLTRSFVRGFGSALGFMAARATVNAVTSASVSATTTTRVQTFDSEEPTIKTSFLQKLISLMIWVGVIMFFFSLNVPQGPLKTILICINVIWVCFGWFIPISIFKNYNKSKVAPIILAQKEILKEEFRRKIEVLVKKLEDGPFPGWAAPMNDKDRFDGTFDENKEKYSLEYLKVIFDTFTRRVDFIEENISKFGLDKFKQITETDPYVGMTEDEFQVWLEHYNTLSLESTFANCLLNKPYPTNVEETVKGKDSFRTLIYGSKRTGNYFKFKNSVLESYTIRD